MTDFKKIKLISKLSMQGEAFVVDQWHKFHRENEDMDDEEAYAAFAVSMGITTPLIPIDNTIKKPNKIIKEVLVKNMTDIGFFDDLEIEDDLTFAPFLKIEDGIIYTASLVADLAQSRPHLDRYNPKAPRKQWLWDVTILGTNKAPKEKSVDIGEDYTLALSKRAMQSLRDFFFENDLDESWGFSTDEDNNKVFTSPGEFKFKRTGSGFNTKYSFKLVK